MSLLKMGRGRKNSERGKTYQEVRARGGESFLKLSEGNISMTAQEEGSPPFFFLHAHRPQGSSSLFFRKPPALHPSLLLLFFPFILKSFTCRKRKGRKEEGLPRKGRLNVLEKVSLLLSNLLSRAFLSFPFSHSSYLVFVPRGGDGGRKGL